MKKPRCDPRLSKISTNDLLLELAGRNEIFICAGWIRDYVYDGAVTNIKLVRWKWGRGSIWEKLKLARWLCAEYAFGQIDRDKIWGAQRRAARGMKYLTGHMK